MIINSRILRLVLLFAIFLTTTITFAQVNTPETSPELIQLSLEELMELKVDVVYSASKYEQKVTEAPSSISIITAEEISKYGYRSLAEILRSIRGFQITNDRNYSFLNVRGFGLPGDYNTRILLLIDGHSINDNIYNMALLGREFPLEIDLIDRIEVVRGPSSSLYGTSAFFAVINVITRNGGLLKGAEISGETGSLHSYKERLSYGNTFDNGLEMLVSGSYYDSKGDERLYFKEFDDPSANNGIADDLDYERYKNLFAKITFRNFTLQSDYHYRKKGVPTASFDTIFNNYRLYTVDKQFWVDMKYENTYSNGLKALARVNYNYYNYYGEYPFAGDPAAGEDEVVINKDSAKGEWIDSELQLVNTCLDKHKVSYGVYYRKNLQQDQKNYYIGADWGLLNDKRDSDNWALYLQDEFTVINNLIFNAGLRYDYYDTFGETINPRAALIYAPADKTTVKLVYGRAFRAPNVYELYYNDGGITQKPAFNLKPEIINTYEAIYEQYIGGNLYGTISGFYYTIEDLITLQTDPSDGLLVFRNVDEVQARGVEFELIGKWKNGLEGIVSYTFQKTENKQTGNILPNSAKHLAKLNMDVPLLKDRIYLGVEEQYTSKRKNVSGTYTDGFFITNLTLFSRNILKNLEVSAGVYNLFDEKYSDPASEEHKQKNIEQDGRTFRLKLTYKF